MYEERWSPGLRQGDLINRTFLPLLGKSFQTLADSSSLAGVSEQQHRKILVDGSPEYLVVISHDCEFNEGKRNKVLVARLQAIRGDLSDQDRQALVESNDVESRVAAEGKVAGVDGFVFDPVDGAFEEQMVAAFTTITPLPMGLASELLDSKIAELQQRTRELFRGKLAWFFGRAAEDIEESDRVEASWPPAAPAGQD